MSKLTKKQKIIIEKVDPEKIYSLSDALEIMQSVKSEKFEESVDIAIRLGVDPNKSDQNVRGAVTLPNSLGKAVTVAVFADGDQADAAKAAGAEHIGMDDLAEKFSKEEINVDVVISTNGAMKVVGKLGQVLGPKGLMPNPKTGTVTDDVATAVNNAKAGQVRFRTDKNGIIHGSIGKVSFDIDKIKANASALLEELRKLKPASAKGVYIGNIALSSTMGPGIKIRIVGEVKEVASNASSLVISDARGLKVSELSEVRQKATQSGIHIQIIKNSLAKLAFEGTDFGCSDEVLVGPSLFAFSFEEPGAAAKLLKTYAKNFDNLEIKALVVEGQLLDGGQIDILASLPSKDEAYGLIANVLQAPVSKFATLLNEVPSKLARVLSAVQDKKQASA